MQAPSALAASPAVEGALVSGCGNLGPASTVLSPVAAGLRAGPGGVGIGRFGWVDANGIVRNARTNATDLLGLVIADIPINSDWRNVFYDDISYTWRIREGLPVTMLRSAQVWAKFWDGSYVGQRVYANVLDGQAISGYSAAGELTPWSVATPAEPQGLSIITPWSIYQ